MANIGQDILLQSLHTNVLAICKHLGVSVDDPLSDAANAQKIAAAYHAPGGEGYAMAYGTPEQREAAAEAAAKVAAEIALAEASGGYALQGERPQSIVTVEEVADEDDAEDQGEADADAEAETNPEDAVVEEVPEVESTSSGGKSSKK